MSKHVTLEPHPIIALTYDPKDLTARQIKDEIAALQKVENDARECLRKLRVESASRKCPFAPGDILEVTKNRGYGKKEKPQTRRYRVLAVVAGYWDDQWDLKVVSILKSGKDGSISKLWHYDLPHTKKVGHQD